MNPKEKKGTVPICAQHPPGRSGKWGLAPFSPDDSLQTLLDAACCDELTDEQFNQLEAALVASDEARSAYLRCFTLIGELRYLVSMKHADDAARQRTGMAGAGEGRCGEVPSALPGAPLFSAPFANGTFHVPAGGMTLDWTRAYLMSAAVLGLFLLVASFISFTRDSLPDRGSLHANNISRGSTDKAPLQRPELVFVGRVSGMVDCQWSDESTATSPGAGVTLGRRYALKSGLMEITYDSGARIILQGPCEYTVESPRGGFLQVGKLVARVAEASGVRSQGAGGVGRGTGEATNLPSPASGRGAGGEGSQNYSQTALTLALSQGERGPALKSPNPRTPNPKSPSSLSPLPSPLFSVRTPTALVEDLGTEFGVEVLQSGETASHVFRGRVVMRVEGVEDGGRGTGDENGKSEIINHKSEIVLSAGQSARVAVGENVVRPEITDSNSTANFVRAMPPPKAVQDSMDYEKLVLSLGPAVYYRMERPKDNRDGVIFDSAPGGHHGQIRLGDNYGGLPFMAGRFGSSLMLRGPDARDYAFVPDYPKAVDDRLTVSVWVYATGLPGWAQIAANWGMNVEGRKNWGQFHLALHQRDGDICARISQRDGEYAELREDEPLPLGSWQHVALVIDGTTARLYRNGKEIKSCPCAGILPNPPLAALGIGSHLNENGTAASSDFVPGYQYWQGRIDELAIFNRALDAQQIEQLYLGRAGKLPTGQTPNKEAK
jgi:hypothetical protein